MRGRRKFRGVMGILVGIILLTPIFNSVLTSGSLTGSFMEENYSTEIPQVPEILSASPPVSASDLIKSVADSENIWEKEDYDMVFVIPPDHPEFRPIAEEFADWKAEIGYHVLILDNYTSFLGRDDAERLRNALIFYYERYNLQWLLLMGDTELIPIRYIYNPDGIIVNDHEAVGSAYLKPTDFYYADLSGNWDIDGDGFWGEDGKHNNLNGLPEVDYYPELYVGRFPVDSAEELEQMVAKTIHYEQALSAGDWMSRYLAISGISDPVSQFSGDTDGEDEAILNQFILENFVQNQMDWRHLEEHTSAYTPPDDPRIESLTKSGVIQAINEGQSIIVYAGHGSPTSFFSANALTTGDIPSLTNYNKTSFLYADACSTNAYDVDSPQSLGEAFVKANNTGGIGYVGSMRISWYYPNDTALAQDNRGLLKLFMQQMFEKKMFQQGKALYESKVAYVESEWFQLVNDTENFQYFEMERKSLFSYMLLGDPSVDLYTDIPKKFQSLSQPGMVGSPYTGSSSEIKLRDIEGNPVAYGRIVLENPQGIIKTFTADGNGTAIVNFPDNTSWVSYHLIGHNMIPLSGNISLGTDDKPPVLLTPLSYNPNRVIFGEPVNFTVRVSDNQSLVENVWLFCNKDNFTTATWDIFPLNPTSENSETGVDVEYSISLIFDDLTTYNLAVVVKDRAGNWFSTFPSELIRIKISRPPITFLLIGLVVSAVLIPLAVAWMSYNNFRKKQKQIIPYSDGNLFIS